MLTNKKTKRAIALRQWNPANEKGPALTGDSRFRLMVWTDDWIRRDKYPRMYEVREIPKAALKDLRELDEAIKAAEVTRRDYLEAHCQEWELIGGELSEGKA